MVNVVVIVFLSLFSAVVLAGESMSGCQYENTDGISNKAQAMIKSQNMKSAYAIEKTVNDEMLSSNQFSHQVKDSIEAQAAYLSCINSGNSIVVASLAADGTLRLDRESADIELQIADADSNYHQVMDQLF